MDDNGSLSALLAAGDPKPAADEAAVPEVSFDTPEMNAFAVKAGMFKTPQKAVSAALSARMPWGDVADQFPAQLAKPYQNELRLEQERDRFKGAQESYYGAVARRMLPGGSAVFNLNEERDYADAVKRFQAGNPEEGDYAKIAGHERLQGIEKERSTGESVLAAVAHVPAILGEGAFAGKLVGGAAKVLAGGAKAAPAVVGTAGSQVEQASRLARTAGFAGRVAATTPLMPSMYLAEAGKRAAQNGGSWTDAKNFAPAYGMGMAQVAVLGSLQKFVTEGSFAKKVVGKTALGMAEQQAVDAGAQTLSDAVLEKAFRVNTGYGLAGDVFRAAQGKENSAVKHALSQAAVFGIFSAMHSFKGDRGAAAERGAEIPSEVAAEIAKMRAVGFDKMAEQKAAEFGAKLEDLTTNTQRWESGPTREAATEALKDVPAEFKPVAEKIINSLPTLDEVAKQAGTTPERLSAAMARGNRDPAIERLIREQGPPVEPPKPETPPTLGVEPVPDAPVPIDHLAVLGEDGLREFAKRSGWELTNPDSILKQAAKSPSDTARLDAFARKASEKPTPPQTSPEGPRTGERPQEPQPAAEVEKVAPAVEEDPVAAWMRSKGMAPKVEDASKAPSGPPKSVALSAPAAARTHTGETRFDHVIRDEAGRAVGDLKVVPRGDVLHVEWVGARDKDGNPVASGEVADVLGQRNLGELLRQVAARHPGMNVIMGLRAGGAHKGEFRGIPLTAEGRAQLRAERKAAGRKPEEPPTLEVEPAKATGRKPEVAFDHMREVLDEYRDLAGRSAEAKAVWDELKTRLDRAEPLPGREVDEYARRLGETPDAAGEAAAAARAAESDAAGERAAAKLVPAGPDPAAGAAAKLARAAGLGDKLNFRGGDTIVQFGGRHVTLDYAPGTNTLSLAFHGGAGGIVASPAKGGGVLKGTPELLRGVGKIVEAASAAGVRVLYSGEPKRAAFYAAAMKRAGYALAETTPTVNNFSTYLWTPDASPAAARAARRAGRKAPQPPTLGVEPTRPRTREEVLDDIKANPPRPPAPNPAARTGRTLPPTPEAKAPEPFTAPPDKPKDTVVGTDAERAVAELLRATRESAPPAAERDRLAAVMDAAGLDAKQRYVLDGLAAGKTLDAIAADAHADVLARRAAIADGVPKDQLPPAPLAKLKGSKNRDKAYTAERIRQFANEAIAKLPEGERVDFAERVAAAEAENRVGKYLTQDGVEVGELSFSPEEKVAGRRYANRVERAQHWIDRLLDRLIKLQAGEEKSGTKVPREIIDVVTDRVIALEAVVSGKGAVRPDPEAVGRVPEGVREAEPAPSPAPGGAGQKGLSREEWVAARRKASEESAAKARAAEEAAQAEKDEARRRAGVKAQASSKKPEDTIRAWVASEAAARTGLRLTDVSRAINKAEDVDQIEAYLVSKGLGLDTLAEQAAESGHIIVPRNRHATDVLAEALQADKKIGEAAFAEAEIAYHEQQAREQSEYEDALKALAEDPVSDPAAVRRLFPGITDAKLAEGLAKLADADKIVLYQDVNEPGARTVDVDGTTVSTFAPRDGKLTAADLKDAFGETIDPAEEAIPWSRGRAAPTGELPTLGVELVTPARLNAEVAAEFGRVTGAKDYRAEPKLPGGANARADLRQRATTTSKMADQDPFVTLEEAAHHLAWNKGKAIETNPAKLPVDVVKGMDALNAEFGAKYKGPRAIVEGYASWVKLRAAGLDAKLTGDAKAAAEWAEKWTRDNNLMGPIDAVTPFFTKYHAQDPTQRAQGYGSSTGLPVEVPRTAGEVSSDLAKRFLDDIDNNLYPAERLEAAIRAAGGRVELEKALTTVITAGRTGAAAGMAARMARDGVHVLLPDGRMQKAGPSVAEIEAGAKPEWLAPGPDGSASKAGAYHTARGIVSMRKTARDMRDEARESMEDAILARDSSTGALREALTKEVARRRKLFDEVIDETEPMENRVSEEMYADYEAALARWNAEPEFGEWAKGFSERLTGSFNAMLDFMASIGEKTPENVQRWKSMFPEYTPTERVLGADEGWNVKVPGKKGEKAPNLSRQASGSGEAIVDPRLVHQQRLLKFAEVFNRNRIGHALDLLKNQPGAGPFVQAYEREAGTRTEKGLEKSEDLRKAGLSGDQIGRALKDMEIADSEVYFRHEPWPTDGRKATYEYMVDGNLTSVRIGDRALYDLVTNQQVDSHQTARLLRAISQMEVLGVKPVQAQAQLVRTLATGVSAAFQTKNVPRDTLSFWRNTTDRASVWQLPAEYWKMAGRFAREFSHNLGTKLGKDAERARFEEDPLWNAFRDARGDQLKQFAFERDDPEASYNGIKSTPNVGSLVKDALNWLGSPELAPRFLEYKNNIERITGRTQEQLRTEYADYYKDLKAGRKATKPLTEGQEALLLNAAWEVTSPFPRQGTVTREFNKITPFFGPAVAGVSKAIRNWKTNPKGALYALGLVAGLRALHWALVKDEKWYDQLSANDKFNNFVVPTPFGPRRLPGPRDLDVAFGGTLVTALDAANGKDPRFKQLLEQSTEAVLPPGIGPAAGDAIKGDVGMAAARVGAMPAGPVGTVGVEMMMNKDWTGKPIVPRREEGKTSGFDQFTDHYGPYALKQLTGGRGELSLSGAGLNIVPRVQNLRESVDQMYERIHELEVDRVKATRAGRRFAQEAEWDRLQAAKAQVEAMASQGRGEKKVGTRVVKGDRPGADQKEEIMLRQAEVARRALGK